MALVVNGVTIPTNVANAITVNGVNITSVYHNAVLVWQQALGPTVGWSGNSIAVLNSSTEDGIQTSGMQYRFYNKGVDEYGTVSTFTAPWQYVKPDGSFSGNSVNPTGYGVVVSGFSIRIDAESPWATYNPSTKTFSGGGMNAFVVGVTTSSGLLAVYRRGLYTGTQIGAYISLT